MPWVLLRLCPAPPFSRRSGTPRRKGSVYLDTAHARREKRDSGGRVECGAPWRMTASDDVVSGGTSLGWQELHQAGITCIKPASPASRAHQQQLHHAACEAGVRTGGRQEQGNRQRNGSATPPAGRSGMTELAFFPRVCCSFVGHGCDFEGETEFRCKRNSSEFRKKVSKVKHIAASQRSRP